MRRRRLVVGASAILAATTAALFVVLHSGTRADALCEDRVFVRGGEFSVWPPGTQCSFGEPSQSSVVMNPTFLVVGLLLALAAFVVWANRPPRAG